MTALTLPHTAFAQDTAPSGEASEGPGASTRPEVSPPVLVETVEASYPAVPRAEGLEARVGLRLVIDASGHVEEAVVESPAGHGFDEAAHEAVLRFRFEPARRGGKPVKALIRYEYVFELPVPLASDEVETGTPDAQDATSPAAKLTPPEANPGSLETETEGVAHAEGATPPGPVEIVVAGERSEAERLQQSAEAVNVVDTRKAKQRTSDMGEVLARTQGVAVRRQGGLGSETRFSLNGLYDEQIRFFLDGVPLDVAGYPFGIENIPVNLVERVEIYRGVVPIRFGADALGGAVNLVSDQRYENKLGASYQVGSFGTHRVTLLARHRTDSDLVFGFTGFADVTQNNYDVDVDVPDARGRPQPVTVPRFHDAYNAQGATFEAGVVDKPWAKRLILKAFASRFAKEQQHNNVMEVPYGEVTYGDSVRGISEHYEGALRENVDLEVVASYAYRTIDWWDASKWVYNWRGQRVNDRRLGGEVENEPSDKTTWEHGLFGRALVSWRVDPSHTVRLSTSPMFTTRSGDERIQKDPDARDPETAQNDLFTLVSGVEYETALFGKRLANIVFVKNFFYQVRAEEPLYESNEFRRKDKDKNSWGVGDSLRYRFAPWLIGKASYEYATRLPRPDEVFGDAKRIQDNLDLNPERSHNANVGPRIDLEQTPFGDVTLDVNGFLRNSDELIILLGSDKALQYENVYSSSGYGVESAAGWLSPDRMFGLEGMLTWQDLRNRSSEGTFENFDGDRLANRPYLFGSWGGSVRFRELPTTSDSVELFYGGRYVHEFFRGWESAGRRDSKDVIATQVTHSAGVTWSVRRDVARVASTFEVDNLTDAKVYDDFGIQRPGRAFYVKLSGDL